MLDPSKPFATSSARRASPAATAKADLTGLLDRARDERFRLLKMLKDARAEVAVTVEKNQAAQPTPAQTQAVAAVAPPALVAPVAVDAAPPSVAEPSGTASAVAPAQLQALIAKLTALDAQLDAKLHRVNTLTDDKLNRLEQLDTRITSVAKQFGHALADGRMLQLDLTASVEQATTLPAKVTEQLERFDDHLAAYQTVGREAFAEQLDQMKQSLLTEMSSELGQQRMHLDTQLAEAHAIAEREIVQRFDQLADSLHDKADGILEKTESTAEAAMRRIRKQVVDAMARAHDTQEAFKSKLDQHQTAHRDHLADLTDSANGEMQVQAQRLDESMTGLADLFESQADQILTELRDRATTLLDQMAAAASKLQDDTSANDTPDRRAA